MFKNSMGSLLEGLTPQERSDLNLKLFFAELDPTSHPSYAEPWLKSVTDEIYTYDVAKDEIREEIRSYAEKAMLHEKGAIDYSLALQRCLDTTDAPYIAVFEDDILVARGWLARTVLALRGTNEVIARSSFPDRDWLALRIFNQERSTGWSSLRPGDHNEFLITVLVDTIMVSVLIIVRRNANRIFSSSRLATFVRAYTDTSTLLVYALVAVPASVILFFQCGKASLLPPSPGLKIENFGCCSQAMIFNRREVPGFIDFLRLHLAEAPYDMLTAFYASTKLLHRLSLYPMQVQHIGATSATGTTKEESLKVWSMAFESLNAAWVDRSHAKAVTALYPGT